MLPGGFEDEVKFLAQSITGVFKFRESKAESSGGDTDVRAGAEKKDHAADGQRICVSLSENRLGAHRKEI